MAKLPKSLKFEDAMQRLDAIVEAMEAGEIGIEESIARYEEAMELAAHCRRVLDEAELRIQRIQLESTGQLKVGPFETPPRGADDESENAG
ncbi:MAG: exodeoxyribonuclease VII small subunit [Phycisphaerae bacterium]